MIENEAESVTPRDVRQIIDAAGGALKIAEASGGSITAEAAYKWPKIGIPERNWPIVMPLAGATEAELHAANVALRQQKVA